MTMSSRSLAISRADSMASCWVEWVELTRSFPSRFTAQACSCGTTWRMSFAMVGPSSKNGRGRERLFPAPRRTEGRDAANEHGIALGGRRIPVAVRQLQLSRRVVGAWHGPLPLSKRYSLRFFMSRWRVGGTTLEALLG